MMRKGKSSSCAFAFVIGLALASSVAACGSSEGSTDATSTAVQTPAATAAPTTLTASKLQPPSQDNDYAKSSGRPQVAFDPCTWIPDSAFITLGLDPSTRERGNDIVAEYTFLTCHVSNVDENFQLDSGNVSLDEVRQKYSGRTQDTEINGRKALLTPQKTGDNECSVDIETKVGYFGITDILKTHGIGTGIEPCDRVVDAAKTLEPYIGEGN